jgi:hypothetical protein
MEVPSTVTLNRLLARLGNTLQPESEQFSRLKGSQYERNKVGGNIEYARTLLLTLEKQASTVRVQSQRQQVQADLQTKREVLKRLTARLDELNQLGDEDDYEEDEDEADTEEEIDTTPSYAPARSDAQDGLDTGGGIDAPNIQLPDSVQSELRSRKPLQASDNRSAASTTAREFLFASRSKETTDPSLSKNETLLSHNRTEQENLTSGLLNLARALKESSMQFSSGLEAEKDVLKRAEGGLDKSSQGMEAAEKKMGTLRRMSEGQGWWGRMKLYVLIAVLWVACFLLVFVGM